MAKNQQDLINKGQRLPIAPPSSISRTVLDAGRHCLSGLILSNGRQGIVALPCMISLVAEAFECSVFCYTA
jgi:hypothetical protein